MKSAMDAVLEFYNKFNIPVGKSFQDRDRRQLRMSLLVEEFNEYLEGELLNDKVAIADALADMIYIICGTALEYDVPLHRVFSEVHRSNLRKVGGGSRSDGKILKPDNWSPPDIAKVLEIPLLCTATWGNEKCNRFSFANKLCPGHDTQRRRGVDFSELRGFKPEFDSEKDLAEWVFSELSTQDNGCMVWEQGTKGEDGYGAVHFKGKVLSVHRLIAKYALCGGTIPDEVVVHHICNNKPCANPEHLQITDSFSNLVESWEVRSLRKQIEELKSKLKYASPQ
jgi:hypothetical protein